MSPRPRLVRVTLTPRGTLTTVPVTAAKGALAEAEPVSPSSVTTAERETSRHGDGTFGHGMGRLCVCGHARGRHLGDGKGGECMACDGCDAFKASRRKPQGEPEASEEGEAHAGTGSSRPCVSVPTPLLRAYTSARRTHHTLPPLSTLLAAAMRLELSSRGIAVPAAPPPRRTAAATAARWRKRSGA